MTETEQTVSDETPSGTEAGGPPMSRMTVSVLSLVGFFDALYLWAHNAGLMGPIVCGLGDCEAVQSSVYSKLGPIPVSALGVAGYVALLVLALVGVQPAQRRSRLIGGLLLACATVGVAFSGYLTYLEARVIHAWCQYCVASAIIMTLIFLTTLAEIPRLKRT